MAERLRFGEFELFIERRELFRKGQRVATSRKVFDCVAFLITHRQGAVAREGLVAAVWGSQTVSDALLSKTILQARRSVGDTGELQLRIRTIARFGFQWVGEVLTDGDVAAGTTLEPLASADITAHHVLVERSRGDKRLLKLTLAAVLLCSCLFIPAGLLINWKPLIGEQSETSGDGFAVVPFDVYGDENAAWMRLGVMDAVVSNLREAGVRVMSADNVIKLVPVASTASESFETLHSLNPGSHLIQGKIERVGSEWRVSLILKYKKREDYFYRVSSNVLVAARMATRDILSLNDSTRLKDSYSLVSTVDDLAQRIDAAALSEDFQSATEQINRASDAMKSEPEILYRAAKISIWLGKFKEAIDALLLLDKSLLSIGNTKLRGKVSDSLCIAYGMIAQSDRALVYCDAAVDLANRDNDYSLAGRALNHRAIAESLQNRVSAAENDYALARVSFSASNDIVSAASTDANINVLLMSEFNYAGAKNGLEKTVKQFREFGLNREFVVNSSNLVESLRELAEPYEALKVSDDALPKRGMVEDAAVRTNFDLARASVLAEIGRLMDARRILHQVILTAPSDRSSSSLSVAFLYLGQLQADEGDYASSTASAFQAIKFFPADVRSEGDALCAAYLLLIRSQLAQSLSVETERSLIGFKEFAKLYDNAFSLSYIRLAEAELAASQGRNDNAAQFFEAAIVASDRINCPKLQIAVATAYAGHLLSIDKKFEAAGVAGRILKFEKNDFRVADLQARLYEQLGNLEARSAALERRKLLAGERKLQTEAN